MTPHTLQPRPGHGFDVAAASVEWTPTLHVVGRKAGHVRGEGRRSGSQATDGLTGHAKSFVFSDGKFRRGL